MGFFEKIFGSGSDDFSGINFGDDFDLFDREQTSSGIFLNRFPEKDIIKFMNKSGLSDYLKKKEFVPSKVKLFRDETLIHHLEIYFKNFSESNMLIDLRLSESRFTPKALQTKSILRDNSFDMIVIEWLSTYNPNQTVFSKERPQLPGQKNPALGCLKYLMIMMYIVAKEITKDGFLDVPDHLHLSLMYSKNFLFFDPLKEGYIRAIKRDLSDFNIYELALADVTGCIKNAASGNVIKYEPGEQIFPVTKRMKKYFESKEYLRIVKEYEKVHLTIDRNELNENIEKTVKTKNMAEL